MQGTLRNPLSLNLCHLFTESFWERSLTQCTAPEWHTWSNVTSAQKSSSSLCSPPIFTRNWHIIHQKHKPCSAEIKQGRNQVDKILSSSSTSGLEGKEVTADRAPTFFTFGRSPLLNRQTNKQTTLWRDSYSCGDTHPGTDRIQTRRGWGKSGVIPGLDLACQERSRPSQALSRQSQDVEEVVLMGECLSFWLTRQRHMMMLQWGIWSGFHCYPLKHKSPVYLSPVNILWNP